MSIMGGSMLKMGLFHVLNHSIENRDLFLDSRDYARFVHNLYEFNNAAPAGNSYRLFNSDQMMDIRCPSFGDTSRRKRLVDIHGWCLMRDHYHLLLSERREGGLSAFMRKINVGYAKYHNERYDRRGFLFRGKTKKVRVENLPHFLYVIHYVHLNPLDYSPEHALWRHRDKGLTGNLQKAFIYLDTYRWSSYLDYCGTKNFPSILTTTLFKEASEKYRQELSEHLRDSSVLPNPSLTLE
ncbi:transposase [Candidatus Parcubacteria bacterium]|nr:transposase [Candidatus Parcubacteria bacterium]